MTTAAAQPVITGAAATVAAKAAPYATTAVAKIGAVTSAGAAAGSKAASGLFGTLFKPVAAKVGGAAAGGIAGSAFSSAFFYLRFPFTPFQLATTTLPYATPIFNGFYIVLAFVIGWWFVAASIMCGEIFQDVKIAADAISRRFSRSLHRYSSKLPSPVVAVLLWIPKTVLDFGIAIFILIPIEILKRWRLLIPAIFITLFLIFEENKSEMLEAADDVWTATREATNFGFGVVNELANGSDAVLVPLWNNFAMMVVTLLRITAKHMPDLFARDSSGGGGRRLFATPFDNTATHHNQLFQDDIAGFDFMTSIWAGVSKAVGFIAAVLQLWGTVILFLYDLALTILLDNEVAQGLIKYLFHAAGCYGAHLDCAFAQIGQFFIDIFVALGNAIVQGLINPVISALSFGNYSIPKFTPESVECSLPDDVSPEQCQQCSDVFPKWAKDCPPTVESESTTTGGPSGRRLSGAHWTGHHNRISCEFKDDVWVERVNDHLVRRNTVSSVDPAEGCPLTHRSFTKFGNVRNLIDFNDFRSCYYVSVRTGIDTVDYRVCPPEGYDVEDDHLLYFDSEDSLVQRILGVDVNATTMASRETGRRRLVNEKPTFSFKARVEATFRKAIPKTHRDNSYLPRRDLHSFKSEASTRMQDFIAKNPEFSECGKEATSPEHDYFNTQCYLMASYDPRTKSDSKTSKTTTRGRKLLREESNATEGAPESEPEEPKEPKDPEPTESIPKQKPKAPPRSRDRTAIIDTSHLPRRMSRLLNDIVNMLDVSAETERDDFPSEYRRRMLEEETPFAHEEVMRERVLGALFPDIPKNTIIFQGQCPDGWTLCPGGQFCQIRNACACPPHDGNLTWWQSTKSWLEDAKCSVKNFDLRAYATEVVDCWKKYDERDAGSPFAVFEDAFAPKIYCPPLMERSFGFRFPVVRFDLMTYVNENCASATNAAQCACPGYSNGTFNYDGYWIMGVGDFERARLQNGFVVSKTLIFAPINLLLWGFPNYAWYGTFHFFGFSDDVSTLFGATLTARTAACTIIHVGSFGYLVLFIVFNFIAVSKLAYPTSEFLFSLCFAALWLLARSTKREYDNFKDKLVDFQGRTRRLLQDRSYMRLTDKQQALLKAFMEKLEAEHDERMRKQAAKMELEDVKDPKDA